MQEYTQACMQEHMQEYMRGHIPRNKNVAEIREDCKEACPKMPASILQAKSSDI